MEAELALRRGTASTQRWHACRFPGRETLGREQRASCGWGFRRMHSQTNAQLLPKAHFSSLQELHPLYPHQLWSTPKPLTNPRGLVNCMSASKGQLSTSTSTKEAEETCSWKRQPLVCWSPSTLQSLGPALSLLSLMLLCLQRPHQPHPPYSLLKKFTLLTLPLLTSWQTATDLRFPRI